MRRWAGVLAATAVLAFTIGTTRVSTGAGGGRFVVRAERASTGLQTAADGDTSDVDPTGCGRPLHRGSIPTLRSLPWPVVLTTGCGRFAALPTGLLTRAPADPGQTADPGYRVPAGPVSWAGVQSGHVVFVRRAVTVWRSAGRAYDAQNMGSAVLGHGWVAFSMYAGTDPSPLYMSSGGQPERVLGHNEEPLVATRWGGFLTSRWRDDGTNPDLVSRHGDGSVGDIVARRVAAVFTERRGTVLYERARKLWRTDGVASVFLADLTSLGFPGYVGAEPLSDGRIFVTGLNRIVVLRPDGRIESSATLAPIPRGGTGGIGLHAVVPWGKALVVAATNWNDQGMGGGPGWEGVYLLQPGSRGAHLLFGRKLNIAICAHSATFSWHERWLLYSACEGRVVAIDTSGRHPPLFLSRLARAVPEPEEERKYGLYAAEWAAFGPARSARTPISLR